MTDKENLIAMLNNAGFKRSDKERLERKEYSVSYNCIIMVKHVYYSSKFIFDIEGKLSDFYLC